MEMRWMLSRFQQADERYTSFSDKKIGDKVVFVFTYQSSIEHVIEKILPVNEYIFTQSLHYFQQLTAEGNLEGVWMVEVPRKGETIDTKNIEAIMEDMREGRGRVLSIGIAQGGNPFGLSLCRRRWPDARNRVDTK